MVRFIKSCFGCSSRSSCRRFGAFAVVIFLMPMGQAEIELAGVADHGDNFLLLAFRLEASVGKYFSSCHISLAVVLLVRFHGFLLRNSHFPRDGVVAVRTYWDSDIFGVLRFAAMEV